MKSLLDFCLSGYESIDKNDITLIDVCADKLSVDEMISRFADTFYKNEVEKEKSLVLFASGDKRLIMGERQITMFLNYYTRTYRVMSSKSLCMEEKGDQVYLPVMLVAIQK